MKVKDLENGKVEKNDPSDSCSITFACERILCSSNLSDKLFQVNNVVWDAGLNFGKKDLYHKPGRPKNLEFTQEKIKFPKDPEFIQSSARAKALHFFANHELLAIEVMAKMILELPDSSTSLKNKKEIWKTLQDEQRHLAFYQARLQELGFSFGDFPVNDFFWKIFLSVNNYEGYFSLMALTFEAANLDFAAFYTKLFSKHGDFTSANIMQKIFEDEIHHVKLGYKFLSNSFLDSTVVSKTNLWDYYVASLPWPITPARSKGIHYQEQHRRLSGMNNDFIQQLTSYQDSFVVTERKR